MLLSRPAILENPFISGTSSVLGLLQSDLISVLTKHMVHSPAIPSDGSGN